MKRYKMKDEQWNRVKEYLPTEKKPHGGRPGKAPASSSTQSYTG